MKNHASIEIDRPIADVFRLTHDHVAEWSLVVVEELPLGEGQTGIGARSQIVTEDRGQRMEFDSTVTEWDPPNRSAIQMVGKMFDIAKLEAILRTTNSGGRIVL